MIVVNVIDKVFGKNIICEEASMIAGYPVYIIDTIGMFLNEIQDVEIDDRFHIEKNIVNIIRLLKQ